MLFLDAEGCAPSGVIITIRLDMTNIYSHLSCARHHTGQGDQQLYPPSEHTGSRGTSLGSTRTWPRDGLFCLRRGQSGEGGRMRGDAVHVGLVKSLRKSEGPFLSRLGLRVRKRGWGRGWRFPGPAAAAIPAFSNAHLEPRASGGGAWASPAHGRGRYRRELPRSCVCESGSWPIF